MIERSLVLLVASALAFGAVYYPVLHYFTRGLVSPYRRADARRRIAAGGIDVCLVLTCLSLFAALDSVTWLFVAALYSLLRDAIAGQSVGKIFTGLVVVDLQAARPCGVLGSVRRNALFLIPGANLVAVPLEAVTSLRDPQGQRLGDRFAHTQVIDGFGARELVQTLRDGLASALPSGRGGVRRPEPSRTAPALCVRRGPTMPTTSASVDASSGPFAARSNVARVTRLFNTG